MPGKLLVSLRYGTSPAGSRDGAVIGLRGSTARLTDSKSLTGFRDHKDRYGSDFHNTTKLCMYTQLCCSTVQQRNYFADSNTTLANFRGGEFTVSGGNVSSAI